MAGRKRPRGDEQLLNPVLPDQVLALPPPRISHRHGHDVDAYESPPGAVVLQPKGSGPPKRKPTREDRSRRSLAVAKQKMRANRYERYLEAMQQHEGDQEKALSEVYGITVEAVRSQRRELVADVQAGIGTTTLAKTLEAQDLSMLARAHVLRKHVYSANPAASLKAIQLVGEFEGTRADMGSFEDFLRVVKGQE